ncbi:diguanylate cyclase domain-containing protein [Mesorhizobium sp. Root157]|uniref:diguanylate cyclase domain-containing protein n=1 Tax=Mesorhizobium sp. Root157 TaxID=1736477 RepID=UPI001FCCD79A|nr:diguanylate cyclase [Mesorhizobium sp. Root157]
MTGLERFKPGNWKRAATLAGGFFATGAASILLSRLGDGIAGLWLPNAFAFAMLARQKCTISIESAVILIATSLAVNMAFGSSPEMAALFAAANLCHIAIALYLTRRLIGTISPEKLGARDFGLVLGAAGGIASLFAGFAFAAATLALNGWAVVTTGWAWFSANALGFAIFLPAMAFVSRAKLAALLDVGALARLLAICAGCIAVTCLSLTSGHFLFAIAMLPLMVLTPRLSVFELALVCSVTGAAAVVTAILGFVPDLGEGIQAFSNGFQVAVAITVSTPFLVGLFVRQVIDDKERIAETETRWNFALASAKQGVWDANLQKGTTAYSDTWLELLGYQRVGQENDPDLWLKLAHPDDIERIKAADQAHMDGTVPYYEAEFRMRHKSGRWIWVLDRGKAVIRDPQGRALRVIGSITDITARKEVELRLAQSAALLADEKERLRVTLRSIGDAVICTDAMGAITFMNPLAEKLTGVESATALGKVLEAVYCTEDEETSQILDLARSIASDRKSDQDNRAVLVRHDRTRCSVRQVVSPITNERGEFCGSVVVFQDFTDARALQRQLAYAATHDALTGLANRSFFIQKVTELVAKAQPDDAGHHFMFIDLDHFKQVNDTSGHAAGDALLKRVAAIIRSGLGPADLVARLGGDEFAVVLQTGSAEAAQEAARTIVAAIAALEFDWNERSHSIGASIGVTPIDAGYCEVDEIIARADMACYAAKAAGRGCVFVTSSAKSAAEPLEKRAFKAAKAF